MSSTVSSLSWGDEASFASRDGRRGSHNGSDSLVVPPSSELESSSMKRMDGTTRDMSKNSHDHHYHHGPSIMDELTLNKLRFSDLGLIGREKELEILQQCLERCRAGFAPKSTSAATVQDCNGVRELVLLQGLSGTGKSALVRHFVSSDKRRLQIWVEGKFDFVRREDEPLSAFIDALGNLSSRLVGELHQKAFAEFRDSLLQKLDKDEITLLVSMVPNLRQVAYQDSPDGSDPATSHQSIDDNNLAGDAEANSQRMKHIFRKLCRVLAQHLAPLVIVLDDTQWADKTSIELMESLLNDDLNSQLLLIACFRSNEANGVMDMRTRLLQSKRRGLRITDMEIGNLSLDHVHRVVSTLLSMDDKESIKTLDLARLCYKRTHGNIFFLQQFIIMLKEEKLLVYHLGLLRWDWDATKIESDTAATANVVGLVTDRLCRLPPGVLSFLQLASCLGSTCRDRTMALVWQNVATTTIQNAEEEITSREDVQLVLKLAKEGNFLEELAPNSHRWLHDKIQEAAMSTIETEQLDSLKCRMGSTLLQCLTKEELESDIFVVANLLSTYRPFSQNDVSAVIELFLNAAEKSTSVAGFQSALRYAKIGIGLLPSEPWETRFVQSLRLYSLAAEASGFLGVVDAMLEYTEAVLNQPKCSIIDKIRVYFIKLQYLQNNGNVAEALKLGLEVLSKLGLSFPRSKFGQAVAAMRLINRLKKKPPTTEELWKLSPMTDRKSKEIIKVIFRLEACFYYTKQVFLYILASARTVELVVEKGLCDYSAGAFFATGNVLAVMSNDLKHLDTWSTLSLLLTHLVPRGHHESRAIFATCQGLAWCRPLPGLPKEMRRGYKVGMKVGDTESAMWNCCHGLHQDFMSGRPLGTLEARCPHYISSMREVRQNEAALVSAQMWRLFLGLIDSQGASSQSTLTTTRTSGESYKAFEAEMTSQFQSSPIAPLFARVTDSLLHCYLREYVSGADLSIQRGNEFLGGLPNQSIGMWDMCARGLCLYIAAQTTGKWRYIGHARKVRKTIEKWRRQGNPNVRHHTALLAAEDFVFQKKNEEARRSYESSILAASRGGFIHDAAVANERYAICLMNDLNDKESARFHLGAADRLYREWGAYAVADGLEQLRLSLNTDGGSTTECAV